MNSIVKYACELNALDIGSTVTWIHKYNYKGPETKTITTSLEQVRHGRYGTTIITEGGWDEYSFDFDTELTLERK